MSRFDGQRPSQSFEELLASGTIIIDKGGQGTADFGADNANFEVTMKDNTLLTNAITNESQT